MYMLLDVRDVKTGLEVKIELQGALVLTLELYKQMESARKTRREFLNRRNLFYLLDISVIRRRSIGGVGIRDGQFFLRFLALFNHLLKHVNHSVSCFKIPCIYGIRQEHSYRERERERVDVEREKK